MKLRLTKRNVYMTERKRENSEYNVIDVNRKIAENVVDRIGVHEIEKDPFG